VAENRPSAGRVQAFVAMPQAIELKTENSIYEMRFQVAEGP
jgi:hypothetical protein